MVRSSNEAKRSRREKTERAVQRPVPHDVRQRYRGCLLGLAAGDALGATNEFSGDPVTMVDIVGGGVHSLKAGQWTDDTSCALCLAESLVACGDLVGGDCMTRLCRWRYEGHLSCKGYCFDVGSSTAGALEKFRKSGDPYQGHYSGDTNGCIMRLAPVPLFFARSASAAVEMAAHSARLTHGATVAVDCARYLAGLLVGCVHGYPKEELLPQGGLFGPTGGAGFWAGSDPLLDPRVVDVARGGYRDGRPYAGYKALECLNAALWAFDRGDDFVSTVRLAADLGHDSDTAGAVAGQLAGAYYGEESIPPSWRAKLTMRGYIEVLADGLFAGSRLKTTEAVPGTAATKGV